MNRSILFATRLSLWNSKTPIFHQTIRNYPRHVTAAERFKSLNLPKLELKYPVHPIEALKSDNPSGWAPPLGTIVELPFAVFRTESKCLPVYLRYRKNLPVTTVVRKYRGDENQLREELQAVVGREVKITQYTGRIEIKGNHFNVVHSYLRRLGF